MVTGTARPEDQDYLSGTVGPALCESLSTVAKER